MGRPVSTGRIQHQMTELERWLREQIEVDRQTLAGLDPTDDSAEDLEIGHAMGYPCEDYLAISLGRATEECNAKQYMLDRLAWCDRHWADGIRRIIALPYSTRPGYKTEWALDRIARGLDR